MPERGGSGTSLIAACSQPLIGVMIKQDGRQVVQYFTSESEADAALAAVDPTSAAGAWADLDWEEMATELDRIRHSVPPTPPIEFDDL